MAELSAPHANIPAHEQMRTALDVSSQPNSEGIPSETFGKAGDLCYSLHPKIADFAGS